MPLPAVDLYDVTLALQAVGWILPTKAALHSQLFETEKAASTIRRSQKFGYYAFTVYSLCAIIAFWFPLSIAILTTLIWILWLIWGISIKHEQIGTKLDIEVKATISTVRESIPSVAFSRIGHSSLERHLVKMRHFIILRQELGGSDAKSIEIAS